MLGLCKHHLSVTSQLSLATCPFLNSVLPPCFASFLRLLGFLCISLLSLSNAQRHSKGLPSCLHQQLFLMSSTEDNLLLAVSPLENWAGAVPPRDLVSICPVPSLLSCASLPFLPPPAFLVSAGACLDLCCRLVCFVFGSLQQVWWLGPQQHCSVLDMPPLVYSPVGGH